MPDPDVAPGDDTASSVPSRSMAEQVTRGLVAVSLVGAVLLAGGWWLVADHATTMPTLLLVALATIVVWAVIYRLLVYGIKRMVRSRIAARHP